MARLLLAFIMVHAAAASCSGSGSPSGFPRCYSGSKSIFGQGESVAVTITDFDTSTGTGHFHLSGSGVAGFTCGSHEFTKDGQTISADLSDCLPSGVEITSLTYCSDQDTLDVSVNDKNIPFGLGKVSVALGNVACNAEVAVNSLGSSCSGTSVPETVPHCFSGSKTVFGEGESVSVTISDFDASASTGHFHLSGSGVSGFTCDSHEFTKDGQSISTDLSDCLPHNVEITSLTYCSDQDTLEVAVNDKNIPWGLGKLTVALGTVACSVEADAAVQV